MSQSADHASVSLYSRHLVLLKQQCQATYPWSTIPPSWLPPLMTCAVLSKRLDPLVESGGIFHKISYSRWHPLYISPGHYPTTAALICWLVLQWKRIIWTLSPGSGWLLATTTSCLLSDAETTLDMLGRCHSLRSTDPQCTRWVSCQLPAVIKLTVGLLVG